MLTNRHSWIECGQTTTEDELWDVYGDLAPKELQAKKS